MRSTWLGGMMAVVLGVSGGVATAADATPGPLMRAALASLEAQQAKSPALRSGKSRDDWSRVLKLSPGSEVILTVRGSRAAAHRLLRADADGVIILDVSGASLPRDVRKELVGIAADRPFTLLAAQSGELQLPHRVRVSLQGVFLEEQRVADLADVLKTVSRQNVADVRVRRKHIGSHSRRGFLIGAAIGAAVGATYGASSDVDPALGLAGAGALVGGVWGLEMGTVVGILAPRSPDVIYHVD